MKSNHKLQFNLFQFQIDHEFIKRAERKHAIYLKIRVHQGIASTPSTLFSTPGDCTFYAIMTANDGLQIGRLIDNEGFTDKRKKIVQFLSVKPPLSVTQ